MDLIDRLQELSSRVSRQIEHLQTEEATKNAIVMPFINALGYDVFNPAEVVPEFTADVGTKKGEKVDYAILRDGQPSILLECKCVRCDIDKEHASQLYRYFSVTTARIGILTNGLTFKFFSDLEEPNKMDSRPFFEFDIREITEQVAKELKKFAKEGFDIENILSTASELKYTKGIKRVLYEEWVNPGEDFVRILASRVYSGRFTQGVREQFTDITKKAFHAFVTDRINERLKSALRSETTPQEDDNSVSQEDAIQTESPDDDGIITTEDEIEGFYVVKSIVREVIDSSRVFMRDTRSYCGVLLDDNNRKPICRLHFNGTTKYLGLFDEHKNETRQPLESVDGIYAFAEQLKTTVLRYDGRQLEAT